MERLGEDSPVTLDPRVLRRLSGKRTLTRHVTPSDAESVPRGTRKWEQRG